MDRRHFLIAGAGTSVALSLATTGCEPGGSVFVHGVAAGDPLPDRLVLWTRVTPSPDATPGSGKGAPVTVTWQVAADAAFRNIVATGRRATDTARDHTVKVDVGSLCADTEYWYRFQGLGATSAVGRARTAPAANATVSRLRFGVVSCSNHAAGWFSGYARLADRTDLRAVLHLGDYIYEYGDGEYGSVRPTDPPVEIITLSHYRRRHAQYKSDPDLKRLHARYAFICTWDDHEVANDTWRGGAENHQPTEGTWAARAEAGRRAYFEWMPIREPAPGTRRLYRSLRFGTLAQLQLADLRQYRDQQPSGPQDTVTINDAGRTMLGATQEQWLKSGLAGSTTRWNLLGSSVMLTPVTFGGVQSLPGIPDALDPVLVPLVNEAVTGVTGGAVPVTGVPYNVDQWDGYAAEQQELLRFVGDRQIDGFVSLVGDIHSAWACELQPAGAAQPVGVELVCTSITSDNVDEIVAEAVAGQGPLPPGSPGPAAIGAAGAIAVETALATANPDVRMVELRGHGYSVLELTRDAVQMDWWEVDRRQPGSRARWARSWRSRHGTNRLEEQPGPVDPYLGVPAGASCAPRTASRSVGGGEVATTRGSASVAAVGAAAAAVLAVRRRTPNEPTEGPA